MPFGWYALPMASRSTFTAGVLISLLLTGYRLVAAAPAGHAQTVSASTFAAAATSSDFTKAVQAGLQALFANQAAQADQQRIQSEDYTSAWDEFGTDVLVDGTTPSAEINRQVTSDIAQSIETARGYDQQEADYLQAQQMTPEQVRSVEQSVGIDVPFSEQIDANPSIDANLDAGADTTSPAGYPASDSAIFNALLQGEQQAETTTTTDMTVTTFPAGVTPAPDTAPSPDATTSPSP